MGPEQRSTRLEVLPVDTQSAGEGPLSRQFKLRFNLYGTDVSMANAIRRVMIAEVPTMAIELVTVLANSSPLHDEYIAHRLGLIPLVSTHIERFNSSDDCDCEDHCTQCSVRFELNVENKKENESVIVTSNDLVNLDEKDFKCATVMPVHNSGDCADQSGNAEAGKGGIVIIKLAPGQNVHMELIAKKGIGKEHAKWSPMCSVAYRIEPPPVELNLEQLNAIFSVDNETKEAISELSEGLLLLNPETHQLEYQEPFLKRRIGITQDTIRRVSEFVMASGHVAADVVRYNKAERFEFSAETTGAMAPAQALKMALDVLRNKLGAAQAHL
jgi:DNA-directed RNA polymerase II subunit RPB3